MMNSMVTAGLPRPSECADRTLRNLFQLTHRSGAVLMAGPPGSGKHRLARLLHARSARAEHPLIPFRCGRLPAAIAHVQLFGNPPSACDPSTPESNLTSGRMLGCYGAARGGTLLLEEVSELDSVAQQQLLQRMRANESLPASDAVRVIATTSRDLREEVRTGRFDAELYYRLSAQQLTVVPLDQRRDELVDLVNSIVARLCIECGIEIPTFSPAAIALLKAYDWPRDLEELEEQLERALCQHAGVLDVEDFPDLLDCVMAQDACNVAHRASEQATRSAEDVNAYERVEPIEVCAENWLTLAAVEANHLRQTLVESRYSISLAAHLLGIDRETLEARLDHHGIRPPNAIWGD